MTTDTDACQAAAEWWARQIGAPTFRVTGDRPGERDFGVVFTEAGMMKVADRNPVTADQAALFAVLLAASVATELELEAVRCAELAELHPGRPPYRPNVGLFTDYHPDATLARAAELAGVSPSRFPVKTGMRVEADHVIASLGYGSPWTLVWSSPDWERPPCKRFRMDGYDAHPGLEVCSLPRYHEGQCGEWVPDPVRCARCDRPETAHYTAAEPVSRCHQVLREGAAPFRGQGNRVPGQLPRSAQ